MSQEWKLAARCRDEAPDLWFPRQEGQQGRNPTVRAATASAKAICHRCPVERECLDYAVRRDVRYGIWGGLDEVQREKLTGRRRSFR